MYKIEIENCLKTLREGDVILYPSDSLWGLGCDAGNKSALEKLALLKGRPQEKSFISLVSSTGMLQNVVAEIPPMAWDVIETSDRPITIVYPGATKPFKHLESADGKIAVRLVNDGFAHDLIKSFGRPLISTSANRSGEKTPLFYSEIDDAIITNVGYAVNDLGFPLTGKPSKVIALEMDGRVKVLR